jgi:hypothetical protein
MSTRRQAVADPVASLALQLSAVEQRVAALEATEAARQQRQRLKGLRRGDAALVARLLAAIAQAWATTPFLSEHLHESLDVNLRYLLAGRSTRKIGRLLGRAEGMPFGAFVVEAAGKVGNRRQWVVKKVVE